MPSARRDPLGFLDDEIAALDAASLLRRPPGPQDGLIVLCSNDYLGYAAEGWPVAEARSGAGASRLIAGYYPEHAAAEDALAAWVGAEAALLFTSGYAANVGAISALAGAGDVIVSDALNHASIVDGCRLSRARTIVVPHGDAAAADAALASVPSARRRWLVTESLFSMEGDAPPLGALRAIADRHGAALVVDEAHALGVLGPRGAGLCKAAGIRADVLVGTCGKALGLGGAFVAGSAALRSWLWNRARSFVFSTGVPPALAVAIATRVARAAVDDDGRARVARTASRLRAALASAGASVPVGHPEGAPIVPWVLGSPERAVAAAMALRAEGFLVQAIRPPTVPPGTCRIRVTASAALSDDELERAVAALARCANDP